MFHTLNLSSQYGIDFLAEVMGTFCVLPTDITTVCPFLGAWPEALRLQALPG